MVAYEEFLAWEAPHHMAFRFNQFTQKFVKAFGEDYQVTDLGDGRCRLVWTVAIEPGRALAILGPMLKPALAINLRRIMKDLRRFLEHADD